ncbi:MAG: HAMP domain-containing sensor histidine kinase [Verrucomicrobiota bacterium]
MVNCSNGLLDAAALESGTLQLNRAYLDLADCVSDVVESNRVLAKHKKQQLVFSTQEGCMAEVDGVRIKQAVDNLVSNAIKFSPLGESISVTLECKGDKARIEVADRGPGLTEADQERLFRRFERLSARPTGGESSTGLGLANARQLVELHGGTMGVESNNQESRFWITLPTQA